MESSENIQELRKAAAFVNGELIGVLTDLSRSRGELKLPEPVTFPGGTKIESFSEQNVEKVIRKAFEDGQIFFGIDPSFSGQAFTVKRVEVGEEKGRVILALFPENFEQRCRLDGIDTKDALKRCLARIIFEDVRTNAQKLPRGRLKRNTIGLVGIFRGKITS